MMPVTRSCCGEAATHAARPLPHAETRQPPTSPKILTFSSLSHPPFPQTVCFFFFFGAGLIELGKRGEGIPP